MKTLILSLILLFNYNIKTVEVDHIIIAEALIEESFKKQINNYRKFYYESECPGEYSELKTSDTILKKVAATNSERIIKDTSIFYETIINKNREGKNDLHFDQEKRFDSIFKHTTYISSFEIVGVFLGDPRVINKKHIEKFVNYMINGFQKSKSHNFVILETRNDVVDCKVKIRIEKNRKIYCVITAMFGYGYTNEKNRVARLVHKPFL